MLYRYVHRQCDLAFSFCTSALRAARSPLYIPRDKWNYNTSPFIDTSSGTHSEYPVVTANDPESRDKPPRAVKMLVRDFIEDSLYNPNYGYFAKQATILDTSDMGFSFASIRNLVEFQAMVARKYATYGPDSPVGPGKQLWHTPTELFKPWYGRAIARCLVSEYLLKYFPYEDFVIYEIGAGNGTLAMDILNYLKEEYPNVYDRTRYNIIEISAKVSHKSIFHWTIREPAPCFFLAMEVIDNFAHDLIRYDLRTLKPYQALIVIDENGDFDIIYTPVTDSLISTFIEVRQRLAHPAPVPPLLRRSSLLRRAYADLPFAPNLSAPEYIPTRLLSLLQSLRTNFPRHRLLLSDFSSLPDAIPGVNAPVVQTRFRDINVPCTTLLVQQGYFDIFFPTNFERLRDMYEDLLARPPNQVPSSADSLSSTRFTPLTSTSSSITLGGHFFSSRHLNDRRPPIDGVASASGLPVGERKSNVFTHAEFLETYADLSRTQLQNGENPLLDFYKNVKFLF